PLGHLGQLDPGGISPEVFQIVVIAGCFIHHVDDDRPVVHQNPPGLLAPLPAEGVLPGSGDLLLDRLHDGAHVGGCLGTGDDKVIGQDGLLSQVQDEDINGLLLLCRLSRQEGDLLSPQLPTPPRPISQGISPRSRSAGSMAQSSGKSFPSTSLREPPSPRMGTSWGRIGSSWASASASSPHPGGTSIWVWGMPKRAAFPTWTTGKPRRFNSKATRPARPAEPLPLTTWTAGRSTPSKISATVLRNQMGSGIQ